MGARKYALEKLRYPDRFKDTHQGKRNNNTSHTMQQCNNFIVDQGIKKTWVNTISHPGLP